MNGLFDFLNKLIVVIALVVITAVLSIANVLGLISISWFMIMMPATIGVIYLISIKIANDV